MNIVITGATSMIGHALINESMNQGENVYAVVRKDSRNLCRIENIHGLHLIKCGIDEYSRLAELIGEKCDVFYHLAWKGAGSNAERNRNLIAQTDNINYTLDAIKAAHELGCKTFVGAGSQAEFGIKNIDKISPYESVDPIQPYGIAKYAAGKMSLIQAKRYGINCFWVRIFSVYGEYDGVHTMIQYSIDKLLNNEIPKYTLAEQRWDYLYCKDAAEALYLIGLQESGNKVYCLGSGSARPLKEYIEIIRNEINPSLPIEIGANDYTDGAVMNLCADISDIKRDTGWIPKTSFEAGIRKVLEFLGGVIRDLRNILLNTLKNYFALYDRKLCNYA